MMNRKKDYKHYIFNLFAGCYFHLFFTHGVNSLVLCRNIFLVFDHVIFIGAQEQWKHASLAVLPIKFTVVSVNTCLR